MSKSILLFLFLIILLVILLGTVNAQYTPDYNIPVTAYSVAQKFPWTGGFNNPQFSEVDLNNDGINDLFVFDRTGNKDYTFINGGTSGQIDYSYQPKYELNFPKGITGWMLLKDYNCDGIADIFAHTVDTAVLGYPATGIQVYRGYYTFDNEIAFQKVYDLLTYSDSSGMHEVYVSAIDVPAIVDMNNDGDLDILTYHSGGVAFDIMKTDLRKLVITALIWIMSCMINAGVMCMNRNFQITCC